MTLLLSPRSGRAGDLLDLSQQPPVLLQVLDSAAAGIGTDDVGNESTTPGLTATDALNALQSQFNTLAADTAGTGLHATGASPQQLTTRLRPRLVQIADYFISGPGAVAAVTGTLGSLGWSLAGTGTPAAARGNSGFGSANPATRLLVSTSAALNDRSVLMLGDVQNRQVLRPADLGILQFCLSQASLATKRIYLGLTDDFTNPILGMTNALGFLYDSGTSPNWQIVAKTAGTGANTVTTTAAVAATGELFTIVRIGDDNYTFWIGNTQVGSALANVADTSTMNVGINMQTLAAGVASFSIGYFGLNAIGASALASDTFLQG